MGFSHTSPVQSPVGCPGNRPRNREAAKRAPHDSCAVLRSQPHKLRSVQPPATRRLSHFAGGLGSFQLTRRPRSVTGPGRTDGTQSARQSASSRTPSTLAVQAFLAWSAECLTARRSSQPRRARRCCLAPTLHVAGARRDAPQSRLRNHWRGSSLASGSMPRCAAPDRPESAAPPQNGGRKRGARSIGMRAGMGPGLRGLSGVRSTAPYGARRGCRTQRGVGTYVGQKECYKRPTSVPHSKWHAGAKLV